MMKNSNMCPYCHESFEGINTLREHAEVLHEEEVKDPISKNFYFEDYLREERVYHELKNRFSDQEEAPLRSILEESVMELEPELPVGSDRNRLTVLRLLINVWPCKHIGEEESADLTNCCENRKNLGEFMDLVCDLYGSDSSDSE